MTGGTSGTVRAAAALAVAGCLAAGAVQAQNAYITNLGADARTVSVIDTRTNRLVGSPIAVGERVVGVAVTPDGKKVYVTNAASNTVSVIAAASNSVIGAPIPVGDSPWGVAVTPDGKRVYVANNGSDSVSVIATATDRVVGDPIPVGEAPAAFGQFIQPKPPFAGTPGAANCAGQSLSAAARRYGGTSAAARALGYGTVANMQVAIRAFCAS